MKRKKRKNSVVTTRRVWMAELLVTKPWDWCDTRGRRGCIPYSVCGYQLKKTLVVRLFHRGLLPNWTLHFLQQGNSSCFPLPQLSVQDSCLLHIRWPCLCERNVSSNQPWWSCWSSRPGRQRKATVRVELASERERTLCRPVLNDRLATPERWLFSEQLHRAQLSQAMSPTPEKILALVFTAPQ